jgi:hypothetical protein
MQRNSLALPKSPKLRHTPQHTKDSHADISVRGLVTAAAPCGNGNRCITKARRRRRLACVLTSATFGAAAGRTSGIAG